MTVWNIVSRINSALERIRNNKELSFIVYAAGSCAATACNTGRQQGYGYHPKICMGHCLECGGSGEEVTVRSGMYRSSSAGALCGTSSDRPYNLTPGREGGGGGAQCHQGVRQPDQALASTCSGHAFAPDSQLVAPDPWGRLAPRGTTGAPGAAAPSGPLWPHLSACTCEAPGAGAHAREPAPAPLCH